VAFNGSGTYVPPAASFPAVASTLIESAKYNAVINDQSTALSTCITKDGQTTITANLPMATYRHTGVSDAAALTDYASANQVVDNALAYGGASAAGTDTYAVSLPISPGAYVAGNRYSFLTDVANTGACTINFNTIGAANIKMQDGTDPFTGAIQIGIVEVEYDGTNFELLNPYFTADYVGLTGAESVAGEKTLTNMLTIEYGNPSFVLSETGVTADNGKWDFLANAEQLSYRVLNDAESVATEYLKINRTGTAIDTVNFSNGELQSQGTPVYVPVIKFKTANETVTSSTTLQDDDHLTGFSLTAGKWYRLRGNLHVTAAAAGALKIQVIFTNAIQFARQYILYTSGASTISSSASTSTTMAHSFPGVTNTGVDIDIKFQANASTGGTFKLQWAQNTSDGTGTVLYSGSYLELAQLD